MQKTYCEAAKGVIGWPLKCHKCKITKKAYFEKKLWLSHGYAKTYCEAYKACMRLASMASKT